MIETTIPELLEKQEMREWVIGVPESEAQYVLRQPSPATDIFARDITPEEKALITSPEYGRVV